MLFSNRPRTHYQNAPVHEVICQLRFPTILTINTTEPADFQELIRSEFPRYVRRQDVAAPRIANMGTPNAQIQQQPPVANYNFLSEDNRWKLNLTKDFIALSTIAYTDWEDFARHLDQPLAAFIKLYQPSYFERVGLRYVNVISRTRLGLEGSKWNELIAPAYTGPLQEPDVSEENCLNCATDLVLKPDSSCMVKVHAGPAKMRNPLPNAPQDPEVKYIFDMDLSMGGKVSCTLSAAALNTLHGHAGRIFEGAVTDELREAMTGV